MSQAPARLSEAEFRALEALLSGTARGRWFLAEYARRNAPQGETETLLTALRRLENVASGAALDDPRADALAAFERARNELAATGRHAPEVDAADAMRGLVARMDEVALDMFANAEGIHQLSWTMRELGFAAATCDAIKARAQAIEAAATQLRLARADADILARCVAAVERGLSREPAAAANERTDAAAPEPPPWVPPVTTSAAPPPRAEPPAPADAAPAPAPEDDRAARLAALQQLSSLERIALCS